MSDLISRQDAVNEIHKYFVEEIYKTPVAKDEDGDEVYTDMPTVNSLLACNKELSKRIKALPSADRPTVDCTEFMEWLKAEVLDEENWELNAVANGEIICRKFKKMGWLDVEDGYYVDTRPTGEWVKSDILPNGWHCSHCDAPVMTDDIEEMLFCPHCGSYNGGEEE